jgi:hypothetical protein
MCVSVCNLADVAWVNEEIVRYVMTMHGVILSQSTIDTLLIGAQILS